MVYPETCMHCSSLNDIILELVFMASPSKTKVFHLIIVQQHFSWLNIIKIMGLKFKCDRMGMDEIFLKDNCFAFLLACV